MNKIISWFKDTFPAKEFMLRSNEGMKYFKLGTFMQVILTINFNYIRLFSSIIYL